MIRIPSTRCGMRYLPDDETSGTLYHGERHA
jgi:hypothetical protein